MRTDSQHRSRPASFTPSGKHSRALMQNPAALDAAMRQMPAYAVPANVRASLRGIAARERNNTLRSLRWRNALRRLQDRVEITMQDLMRPLAVPVAGGVFSAVLLFSVWVVPTYPIIDNSGSQDDVPIMLVTDAKVKGSAPISSPSADLIVDITVDDQGRMVDYEVVSGSAFMDVSTRRTLENRLVFTEFIPATSFGRPRAGKMRLLFSNNRVDVKG